MKTSSPLDYAAARQSSILRESSAPRLSEIEIQARLFNGEYGTRWLTLGGSNVEILHFGEWNREAGPDFKGATIRYDDREPQKGDIEVDWDARDWERHGHATNPAYTSVQLHIFITDSSERAFARTVDHREVPQARLEWESVSVPALKQVPGAVEPDVAKLMIAEAAEFRLRMKHAAHARAASLHGPDAALFHAIATGLGYKNNAVPFLLTAQRAGWRSACNPSGEAHLFGIAGFLIPRTFDDSDEITRRYLKPLWDEWWTVRDSLARVVLPKSLWKFSGIRPSNHPHRRLGALAALALRFNDVKQSIRSSSAKGFFDFLQSVEHPYWSHHWNLSASRLEKTVALIGSDRATDLLINAFLPSLSLEVARAELQTMRGPQASGRLLRACEWLVGNDDSSLYRTAADQQGLLQLFTDFGSLTPLEAWSKIQSGRFIS